MQLEQLLEDHNLTKVEAYLEKVYDLDVTNLLIELCMLSNEEAYFDYLEDNLFKIKTNPKLNLLIALYPQLTYLKETYEVQLINYYKSCFSFGISQKYLAKSFKLNDYASLMLELSYTDNDGLSVLKSIREG